MKYVKNFLLLILLIQLSGCIMFNSVSYEVNFNEYGNGTATVIITDLCSDASTKENLDEDIKSILEYGLTSQEFVREMKKEGKNITSRNLLIEREKLNAVVRYEFTDISSVEGMQFDDPYYYLTVPPEDSIISTNGQVTKTVEYQRIVWDKSITSLKFKMYSDNTSREDLKSLAPYYLKEN